MTNHNVANSFNFVTEKTIDTQQLLILVNQTRQECNEKPIRNNDFLNRIKDELNGEFYETFVKPSGEAGGRPIEVISMNIKQALRVAARESKTVRRSLVDKLETMYNSRLTTPNEIIAAMALANVEHDRRIAVVEQKMEHMEQGTIPVGYQGYSYLKATYGLSDAKSRQLVMAWSVPHKKVPHVAPGGQVTQMSVVHEESFEKALRQMMKEAEQRGSQWYHAKMGRFSATDLKVEVA
ncbi:hypothetical protein [Xenorhabdus szentirmaii]|uniref:hypothetical protein n=1 Tax=Xenorhabdus szentirmaii TaxID=290112 RepID=UPI000C0610DF|nr:MULTISPECIES: hypothetical protein [Xenorhabdus]PHM42331.1 hypothetical protein Xszus_02065 [Xenorhabdus szentirmaii]